MTLSDFPAFRRLRLLYHAKLSRMDPMERSIFVALSWMLIIGTAIAHDLTVASNGSVRIAKKASGTDVIGLFKDIIEREPDTAEVALRRLCKSALGRDL